MDSKNKYVQTYLIGSVVSLSLLLLFMLPLQVQGSNSLIDSLKQELATATSDSLRYELCKYIGDEYYEGDFDSLLTYYDHALVLAQKTGNFRGEISTLRSFAYVHKYRKDDYDKAAFYFEQALQLTRTKKDTIAETYLLHDFGELYRSKGDHVTAIDYFFKSNKLAEARQHKHLLTRTWFSLGLLYNEKKQHEEALNFYNQALALTNDSTYARMKGLLLNNIGKAYHDIGKHDKATQSFTYANRLFKELDDNDSQVDVLYNFAKNEYTLTNYATAINYYQQALKLNDIINNRNRATKILLGLSETYLAAKHYKKAITTAQKGLQQVEEIDTYLHRAELNEVLTKSYTHFGNYQQALFHQQAAIVAKDSLQQEAAANKLLQMTLLYEQEKKNVEIEQLRAKNAEQQMTTNQATFRSQLLGLLMLLCLLLGAVLWKHYENKHLEKYKQLRIQLTNDLHDNISSSLNHIKIIANKISSDTHYSIEEKKEYAKKLKSISKGVVHNMHDLIWGLDDKKETLQDLLMRMMDHANQVLGTVNMPYEIDNQITKTSQLVKAEVKNNIYAIFKEAINNIVKHTQAEKVEITFTLKGGLFTMYIKNDTNILLDTAYSSNIGLKSIRQRATAISGKVAIDQTDQYFLVSLGVGI